MPSPVAFNVSLAPLPANFSGTPQQWATEVVNRLTVEPQDPWNSFLTGDQIPSSDMGPLLYQNKEWRVFDTALGAYTFHRQNGAGIVDATVPLAKLSVGTAGSVLIYNGSGRPAELLASSGVGGQVLTLVGGTTPTWVDTFVPGGTYFEVTLGTDQSVNTNGSTQQVGFDTVRASANVTFDTGNSRVPVLQNQVWFFYAQLQIEDSGAASTGVQFETIIRRSGTNIAASVFNYDAALPRFGTWAGGIVTIPADGNVDVAVVATETTPSATGLTVAGNATNTRFGGYRLI